MKKTKIFLTGFILTIGTILLSVLFLGEPAKAQGGTAVTGKVTFEGTPPAPQLIKMDADPVCASQNPKGLPSEEVIVNPNGTLKNVFVYVKEGLPAGQKFEAPKDPVAFDQRGCHYTPHVFAIMAGQPIQIINSDGTLHNVHALPKNSKEFNLGMPIQGMKLNQKFDAPEVMVKFKCEVHPWMNAYAGVLEHPFFAVTGEDGTFSIKDLPAGQYTFEAWHEKYGTQTATVKVPDQTEANFTFKAS